MKLLENKVAIITGGSRGIGAGIVKKFAEQGADVAFTYRSSEEQANKIVEQASVYGTKVQAFKSDASSLEQTTTLIADVLKVFGKIDVLVNNAGITRDNLLMRMSEDNWDDVMNINLKSVFNTTKHAQRSMLKQRSGSIINISSIVGLKGNAGQANYAASKAGIIGFTKSVALELGSRGIRCNAVAPGFIETEMTSVLDEKTVQSWRDAIPLKRGGKPEDVANACVYLGSDLSSYVSGQVLQVDGGLLT